MAARKQREREREREREQGKAFHSDLFPPIRLQFLKVPLSPKISPPAQTKPSTYEPL
jgi:hypothetical protein